MWRAASELFGNAATALGVHGVVDHKGRVEQQSMKLTRTSDSISAESQKLRALLSSLCAREAALLAEHRAARTQSRKVTIAAQVAEVRQRISARRAELAAYQTIRKGVETVATTARMSSFVADSASSMHGVTAALRARRAAELHGKKLGDLTAGIHEEIDEMNEAVADVADIGTLPTPGGSEGVVDDAAFSAELDAEAAAAAASGTSFEDDMAADYDAPAAVSAYGAPADRARLSALPIEAAPAPLAAGTRAAPHPEFDTSSLPEAPSRPLPRLNAGARAVPVASTAAAGAGGPRVFAPWTTSDVAAASGGHYHEPAARFVPTAHTGSIAARAPPARAMSAPAPAPVGGTPTGLLAYRPARPRGV